MICGVAMLRYLLCLPLVAGMVAGCDKTGSAALKGQTNTTVTFYGKALDQLGHPVSGAAFEFRVEAYPKDWSYETRDRDNESSTVLAISDENGRFEFTVTGCKLVRLKAELAGYRHLYDLRSGDSQAIDNTFYRLVSWGDLCYRTDAKNPATFLFIKNGNSEAAALPSRGGENSGNGKQWVANAPGWPKKPSLEDVVQKPAASQPTTSPQ